MSDTQSVRDFNPIADRAPIEFERPAPRRLEWLRSFLAPAAPSILVVDLSHHNGVIDWVALRNSGIKGVILKCSEGVNFKDPKFESNWQAACDNDFAVMLYHFFRDGIGASEFDWFISCAASFLEDVGGHTAVALDVETDNGVSKQERAGRAFTFCMLAKGAGLLDGIYSSPYLVNALFPSGETRWSQLSWQWVAHWTPASDYALPAGWSRDLVRCWQYGISPTHSWTPRIQGAGTVDVNRMFFATEQELKQWLGQDEPIPYPYMVRVISSDGAIVRQSPKAGLYLRIEPVGALLGILAAAEDVDGAIWLDTGAGYVRESATEKITNAWQPGH